MSARFGFDFQFHSPQRAPVNRPSDETPLRILVMGDITGRGNRGVLELGDALTSRPCHSVDIDNYEDLLSRLAPELRLPIGNPGTADITVRFRELDDFHPDRLYQRLEVFRALRELRSSLLDPATFAQAAAELRDAAQTHSVDSPSRLDAESANEDNGATLERLLGGGGPSPPASPSPAQKSQIDGLIQGIVAPHIAPGPDPFQEVYVASVDEAIAAQMRRILHEPAFQQLESAWRGIHALISRLETGQELRVHVLDVSKAELAADLAAAGSDLQAAGLYKSLVDKTVSVPGGVPWSLLLGLYSFAPSPQDVQLLAALGAVGAQAGAPFVSTGSPETLGCSSLAQTPDPSDWAGLDGEAAERWQALRHSPIAPWLGLVLPRMLMRLPYGAKYDELDAFEFEEVPDMSQHESFLWGDAALACGLLVGESFAQRGWAMEPGDILDVDDLPACVYKQDGESKLLPCAEAGLTERAADRILAQGIMPLMSYKNRPAARLARIQSLADPPAALAGPWQTE